jgi:hypothetical protein
MCLLHLEKLEGTNMATLTDSERKRITNIESAVTQLAHLVKGGGSLNQLNRLLVLAQSLCSELKEEIIILETKMDELLELTRKLQ